MKKKIKKKILAICISVVSLFIYISPAFAHIIVHPNQVGIAATQDFIVNVPNEKDNPVISVKLIVPDGITSVVPYVIAGWAISTKTNGTGDNATVTEIDWDNGSIPVGQAAELGFQAQVPAKQTTLAWKAYQTYSDGTVVSWDVNPAKLKNLSDAQQDALAEKQNKGVYSTTQVVNDLTGKAVLAATTQSQDSTNKILIEISIVLAGIAVSVSFITFKSIRSKQ